MSCVMRPLTGHITPLHIHCNRKHGPTDRPQLLYGNDTILLHPFLSVVRLIRPHMLRMVRGLEFQTLSLLTL